MAKYGNGISFDEACMMEKEQIRHPLNGELSVGANEDGFVYEPAGKEDCDRCILGAYDGLVFQAKEALAAGRALEKLMRAKGLQTTLQEFLIAKEKEKQDSNGYRYESDGDE